MSEARHSSPDVDITSHPILELQQEDNMSPSASASKSPIATSALSLDVPVRPVSTSVVALARKTYAQEESLSRQREIMAAVHASAGLVRRNFKQWVRYARVEAIGKRFAAAVQRANTGGWFRNWRDLSRIARGEFHMWAHGKARDAEVDAIERERQWREKAHQEERRRAQAAGERMVGQGVEVGEVPSNETLYAGSSRTPPWHRFTHSDLSSTPRILARSDGVIDVAIQLPARLLSGAARPARRRSALVGAPLGVHPGAVLVAPGGDLEGPAGGGGGQDALRRAQGQVPEGTRRRRQTCRAECGAKSYGKGSTAVSEGQ